MNRGIEILKSDKLVISEDSLELAMLLPCKKGDVEVMFMASFIEEDLLLDISYSEYNTTESIDLPSAMKEEEVANFIQKVCTNIVNSLGLTAFTKFEELLYLYTDKLKKKANVKLGRKLSSDGLKAKYELVVNNKAINLIAEKKPNLTYDYKVGRSQVYTICCYGDTKNNLNALINSINISLQNAVA